MSDPYTSPPPPVAPQFQSPTPPAPGGFGRFTKHIVLGAVFGGLFSSIPLLSCLNLFFCLMNIAGIALALHLYLKSAPQDSVSNGEAAVFGLAAGAGAGLIAGVLGMFMQRATMAMLAPLMKDLGPQFQQQMAMQASMGVFIVILDIVLFAAFGALGGFLAMQLFFKARIRK